MTPQDLIAAFEAVAEAPGGATRLRELVLQLAVRGQLVPQNEGDEPADALLERLRAQRAQLVKSKAIKKPKKVPPVAPDAVPFPVPPTWRWARFVDVANIASNLVKPAKYKSKPHIAPNYIEKATGRLLPYQTVAEDGVKSAKHRFSAGQILYSKIRPNLSKVITVDFEGLCSADMYPIDPWIDRGYLHAYMLSMAFLEQATDDDNRLAMPKVNQEQLSAVMVAVPPLPEQKRIVAKVDELMGLLDRLEAARDSREATRVALRDAALAALRDADSAEEVEVAWQRIAERMDDLFTDPADVEPLRQTVLQLAVRGLLVPQDEGDEPGIALVERVAAERAQLVAANRAKRSKPLPPVSEEEKPFDVPGDWGWIRLGQGLVDGPTNGWSPKSVDHDTGVRTLKLSATTRGHFDGRHFKFVEADLDGDSPLWLRTNDLLIQRSNTPEYVGMAAIFDGPEQTFIYPDLMMRCRVSKRLSTAFVHLALIAPYNRSWFSEKASGTSQSMVKLNQQAVRSTIIPLPPLAAQRRIVAKVGELMGMLDRLRKTLESARTSHGAFAAAAIHHLDARDRDSSARGVVPVRRRTRPPACGLTV